MPKNVGKDGFEILGQTGVPPVTYPDLAGMALGMALSVLTGWAGRARGAARKKVSVLTGNRTDFAQARARRGPGAKKFLF